MKLLSMVVFRIFTSVCLFCSFNSAYAGVMRETAVVGDSQEVESAAPFSVSFGMDLVSRYIWRGVEFGVTANSSSTPHFQPNVSLTYDFGGAGAVGFGFWGSYGFDGSYSENDLYLSYTINTKAGTVALTVNDYYYPYLNIPFSNTEGDGLGAHTLDAQFSYTLPEAFPLTLVLSNNIHNDAPGNKSFYFETSYPFTVSNIGINVFAGFANGQSLWHSVTTDKFEMINAGFKLSKQIKVTEAFSIPAGIAWIYNAALKRTYLVFKISI